ncbi:YolD-like family protein [Bacillus haynesii]|nr:YolD-like family protein [Bacillus haynesii]MEC0736911.1 YolD-like family protein [Bacillus haynesii]
MVNDNLKDRGTLKWTSVMSPEHVSLLRELQDGLKRIKRPVLDMSQKDDMELVINEGMEFNLTLHFEVFKARSFLNTQETGDIIHLEGKIHYINQQQQIFHIVDSTGDTHFIKFKDLIGVSRF